MDYGVITPRPKKLKADQRLPIIEKSIESLIDKFQPGHVLLEIPAGGKEDDRGPEASWLTMSVLFMCHGVVRCLLQKKTISYSLISPSTWINRVGIFKRDRTSRKEGAKNYAIKKYCLPETLEQDVYDAICLFDCYEYLKEWESKQREEISAF